MTVNCSKHYFQKKSFSGTLFVEVSRREETLNVHPDVQQLRTLQQTIHLMSVQRILS